MNATRPAAQPLASEEEESVQVCAQQRNHDTYTLPDCLSHLPAMPLYLAVAHLGQVMQAPLSRQMISLAFGLDTRRTLATMRYLLSGQTCVLCERLPPRAGEEAHGYRLRILAIGASRRRYSGTRKVRTPAADARAAPPRQPARPVSASSARVRPAGMQPRTRTTGEQAHQALRRWFLQRPNVGGGKP